MYRNLWLNHFYTGYIGLRGQIEMTVRKAQVGHKETNPGRMGTRKGAGTERLTEARSAEYLDRLPFEYLGYLPLNIR